MLGIEYLETEDDFILLSKKKNLEGLSDEEKKEMEEAIKQIIKIKSKVEGYEKSKITISKQKKGLVYSLEDSSWYDEILNKRDYIMDNGKLIELTEKP